MDGALKKIQWLQSDEDIQSLCGLTVQYIVNELDPKEILAKSESLGVESHTLTETLQALGFMFTKLAGNQSDSVPEPIQAFYNEHQDELRPRISASTMHDPLGSELIDLDWRFELQVASRAVNEMVQPRFILRTNTTAGETVFEADYANMRHLYEELSRALKTLDNNRAKRVDNFIKPSKGL